MYISNPLGVKNGRRQNLPRVDLRLTTGLIDGRIIYTIRKLQIDIRVTQIDSNWLKTDSIVLCYESLPFLF